MRLEELGIQNNRAGLRRITAMKVAYMKAQGNDNGDHAISRWTAIPAISADAKRYDIVRDFSTDSIGHAGIVQSVRVMKKRNGQMVRVVEMCFIGHAGNGSMSTRTVQIAIVAKAAS